MFDYLLSINWLSSVIFMVLAYFSSSPIYVSTFFLGFIVSSSYFLSSM